MRLKFTTLPPLIAATLLAALAAARAPAAPPAGDPFAGDDRLAVHRTIHTKNAAVRDLLADLNEQTGIRFFADPSVQDEPVTVFAHDRPLADTLRALAGFEDAEWTRDGVAGQYGYTLRLTDEARARQAAYVTRRLGELADVMLEEAKLYEQLGPLPQKQRETMQDALPARIGETKDPVEQRKLQTEARVLADLRDGKPWRALVYKLLRGMDREQLVALMRSGRGVCYAWPDAPGCLPWPEPVREEARWYFAREFVAGGTGRAQVAALRLRLTPLGGRRPYIRVLLQMGQRSPYGTSNYGLPYFVPVSYQLLAGDESQATADIEPKEWRADPDLSSPVLLRFPDLRETDAERLQPQRARGFPLGPPPDFHWLSDALDALDHLHPTDLIADALWTAHYDGPLSESGSVGQVLTAVSRLTGRRWWKQDGFVRLKSRAWEADRWVEPPATALARWREAGAQGGLHLDDVAEIAALPDAQLVTLQEMAAAGQFPVPGSVLGAGRSHLLLWAALSQPQRRQARAAGVRYSLLTPEQRLLFAQAVTDPTTAPISPAIADASAVAGAKLRVDVKEHPMWGVHRPNAYVGWQIPRATDPSDTTGMALREDAIRRFQQADPSIKKEEVQPMTVEVVTFYYDTDRETLAHIALQLPPHWEDAQ